MKDRRLNEFRFLVKGPALLRRNFTPPASILKTSIQQDPITITKFQMSRETWPNAHSVFLK